MWAPCVCVERQVLGVERWVISKGVHVDKCIVVCTENGLLASVFESRKLTRTHSLSCHPATSNFESQGKENRVSTQCMPQPLRGSSTHTLKQGHRNHVAAGPVWLVVGVAGHAQAASACSETLSRRGKKTKHDFFFSAPVYRRPTGHSQCKRQYMDILLAIRNERRHQSLTFFRLLSLCFCFTVCRLLQNSLLSAHTLKVRSCDAVTSRRPSGVQSTPTIRPSCPSSVLSSRKSRVPQT